MQPQPELLSTTHWRAMASDTGFKLVQYLEEAVPAGSLFYVQAHAGDTDFDRIFRNALVQELQMHGIAVVPTRARATHVLGFGTRVSDHDPDGTPVLGSLTMLSAGLWGVSEVAKTAPIGATATAGAATLEFATAEARSVGLSEITVSIAVLGAEGAEITRDTAYYVARRNAHNYPELALPPLYAPQGRPLPEPPVAHFMVE